MSADLIDPTPDCSNVENAPTMPPIVDVCALYLASAKTCLGEVMAHSREKSAIRTSHLAWRRENISALLEIHGRADLVGGAVADFVFEALHAVDEALERVCHAWGQSIQDHIGRRAINAGGAYCAAQRVIEHAEQVFHELKSAEEQSKPRAFARLDPTAQKLLGLLAQTPQLAKELAVKLGFDPDEVKLVYGVVRVLRRAKYKIQGSKHSGYWIGPELLKTLAVAAD